MQVIIYVTVLSSKVPNTFWLELTENLNPLSHFEWPNISIHHVEVLYPVYGSPVKYFLSSCIDVVLNRSNHLLVMINRLASFFFIWNQNWLFYHIVFQVCFQILVAASYLCLWEIDLCSIWWMQAKPYRCPNCFSCHYHDPPFFQSYNTHKHWMKKKIKRILYHVSNL